MKLFLFLLLFFCGGAIPLGFAQEFQDAEISSHETLEAVVQSVVTEEGMDEEMQRTRILLQVTKGSLKGQEIEIVQNDFILTNRREFVPGDEVMISRETYAAGEEQFFIIDYVRSDSLFWLALIFFILVIAIGRWRGAASLLGMGISFLVIFYFLLPQILQGRNPVLIALLSSALIAPCTFYFSHGFNRKTTVAILGTLVTFVVIGFLADFFVDAANLSGFADEEASFLQAARGGVLNMKGILLAGMIIGILGILDDITISQAAIVQELKAAKEKISFRELYFRAMRIGRDHIASLVNTLILVYTGAALPLLLLFLDDQSSFSQIINYENVAEEIVRTLIGSIGLVLAVPITTLLACFFLNKVTTDESPHTHGHFH